MLRRPLAQDSWQKSGVIRKKACNHLNHVCGDITSIYKKYMDVIFDALGASSLEFKEG